MVVRTTLGALGEMSLLLPAAPINPDGSCSGLEVLSAEVMLTVMGTTHQHVCWVAKDDGGWCWEGALQCSRCGIFARKSAQITLQGELGE